MSAGHGATGAVAELGAAAAVGAELGSEPEPTEPEPTEPEPTEPEPTEPEPTEHDDDDADDEAPPEASRPSPEERMQAEQIAQLETAQTNYERRIRKIMGPDVLLVECEACSGMGLVPPGGLEQPELSEHGNYRTCASCAGWGSVLTGSKVQGSDVVGCPDCKGFGYQVRLDSSSAQPHADGNGHAADEFGVPSWMGDPNLGGQ